MPDTWSPTDERQYQHVLTSTGDKSTAAAIVNKTRKKQGRSMKWKRKGAKAK